MSFAGASIEPAALAAAALEWWALAGVDLAVQDEPRGWLDRPKAGAVPSQPAPVVEMAAVELAPLAQATVSTAMPADLDGFLSWLATEPAQPEAAFSSTRVLPRVLHRTDVLLLTDMPSQDDMVSGKLFSSEGDLLFAMLRAIGVSLDRTATASLLLARPAGGMIDDALAGRVLPRTLHLLGLLAPKAVILLGDRTSRALAAVSGERSGLPTRSINLDNGNVSALSLPAPFVLVKHPERKAAAWAQLRHMAKR